MNLVELRIKRTLDTSRYGALSDGDILRTDAAYARHLVDDLAAAVYIQKPAAQPARTRKPKTRKEKP